MNVDLRILNIEGNLKNNRGELKLKLPQINLSYGNWQMNVAYMSFVTNENLDELIFLSTNFYKDSKINRFSEIEVYNPIVLHCTFKGTINSKQSITLNEHWIPINNFSNEIVFYFYNEKNEKVLKNCVIYLCLHVRQIA